MGPWNDQLPGPWHAAWTRPTGDGFVRLERDDRIQIHVIDNQIVSAELGIRNWHGHGGIMWGLPECERWSFGLPKCTCGWSVETHPYSGDGRAGHHPGCPRGEEIRALSTAL